LRRLEGGTGSPQRATSLHPAKQDQKGAPASPEGNRQPLPQLPEIDRGAYVCVQSAEVLRQWIERAFAARLVAIDTETSSLDPIQAGLIGVSLALGPNDACYIPLCHGGTDLLSDKPQQIGRGEALRLLKPLLESDAVLKVGQNIKFDLNVLTRAYADNEGIDIRPIDDTMIMSFALDAGRSEQGVGGGHGMDELSERHLGHIPLAFKDICGTGRKAISFAEVPLDKATEYAAEDADITWRLHCMLKPRLSCESGTRIYERVD